MRPRACCAARLRAGTSPTALLRVGYTARALPSMHWVTSSTMSLDYSCTHRRADAAEFWSRHCSGWSDIPMNDDAYHAIGTLRE